uniref:BDBT FKBP like N-terminal domain-containing protein n=1 Tax=Bracon brevicornis TaxID=1563983 RepID=A0A6V7KV69_9HYME
MKTFYENPDGTVRKEVLTHGKIVNKPMEGSICYLTIKNLEVVPPNSLDVMTLNSGILIGRSEVCFTVDETLSEVDQQIEKAIRWMGEGEVAAISINLPSLPRNEEFHVTIKFIATLTKIIPFKPMWEWTPEEKYERSLRYKEIAVCLINAGRIKDAFHRFSKACKIIISMEPIDPDLELPEELLKKIQVLRTSLYNNMAMCQLKYDNYEHAIDLCTKVLQRDENNVKALYRRGCAYGGLKNLEKAVADFQRAVEIEPNNTAAKEKLRIYGEKWRIMKKESNDMVKRMFKS